MLTGQFRLVGASSLATAAGDPLDGLSDEELLDRFVDGGDDAAEAVFRAIVVRHGPMVLGVCRHVLNQLQDAEDAFQATFLVLARKAGSIRDRRVLAHWLYEVAYRIAMRAKSNGGRRRALERQGGEMAATVSVDNHGWIELKPVLHEEVNRLPEKYRVPVILCYLEGKTNEEVAQLLHWPVGTVKGRLSRARDILRSRLTRRGLALSAALLVTSLSNGTVIADVVPCNLIDETVTNAMRITNRAFEPDQKSAISPEVYRLMDFADAARWKLADLAAASRWWKQTDVFTVAWWRRWKRSAVVVLLAMVIVGALASIGYSSGLRLDAGSMAASFSSLAPFGRPSSFTGPSSSSSSSLPTSSTCNSAQALDP
jgi:RNA polymerase sigma factor (sigma-70 family)